MTVSAQTPYSSQAANGVTTSFPFAYKIRSNTDIVVVLVDASGNRTTQTMGVHYTVSGVGSPTGGSVVFTSAPATGMTVKTYRVTGLVRSTDYQNNGDLLASILNGDLDAMWLALQEFLSGTQSSANALRAPIGEVFSSLVSAADRANKALVFDVNGNVGVSADIAAEAASAAVSRAAIDNRLYPGTYAIPPATRPDSSAIQGGDSYFGTDGYTYVRVAGVWVNQTSAAAASAATASTQGGIATTQAGLATTAKTAAETARDAAVAAGATVGAYPNSGATAVPGGVAVGAGYWVQSADGYTLNRYKNVGGVATADPTVGPLGLQNLQSVGTDTSLQADTEATVDSLGYVGTRLTTQGRLGKIPAVVQPLAYQGKVMHHFLDYGQSLSNGWNAVPPITTSGMFDDVWMFNGGVNTAATSENPAVSMTSITPYFEQVQGSSGETPNGGRVARLVQVLRERHGKSLRGAGLAVLCSSAGKDGLSLANFVKGSTYYTRIINQVTQGKALATAAGYTYRIAGIFFDQGQSDGATAVATYLATLQQIQSDLQADIRAITGGTETVRFFLTTTWLDTGLAAPYSHPGSTLAQLAAHAADPTKFIIVTPPYQQNTIDGTHWTAFDSGLAGAYGAEAYLEQIIYGGNWNCVEPISFDVTGAVVTIRFACPGGQLVLDTKQARLAANYGFLCTDRTGAAYTINSVALSGADRVVVTLSGAPASGLRVKYGDFSTQQSTWNYVGPLRRSYGSRGNLRDNSGDLAGGIYRHPSNRYAPMHRWCVQFDSVVIA